MMAICGLVALLTNERTDRLERAGSPQVRIQTLVGGSVGLVKLGIFGLEKLCGEARLYVAGVEGQITRGEVAQSALIRDVMHLALVRFPEGTPHEIKIEHPVSTYTATSPLSVTQFLDSIKYPHRLQLGRVLTDA